MPAGTTVIRCTVTNQSGNVAHATAKGMLEAELVRSIGVDWNAAKVMAKTVLDNPGKEFTFGVGNRIVRVKRSVPVGILPSTIVRYEGDMCMVLNAPNGDDSLINLRKLGKNDIYSVPVAEVTTIATPPSAAVNAWMALQAELGCCIF